MLRMTRTATLAMALLGALATGAPAATPAPDAPGTPFASGTYPYTLVLPAGWRDVTVDGATTGDLFGGPGGAGARMGSAGPVPGQTVEDRVAANRAELMAQGCESDPAADRPATLGGEEAVEWSFRCADSATTSRNAIHDGIGYRLSVTVPVAAEPEAAGILAGLADSLAFTAAPASPAPAADLAAIDARLQGTWRTEWAPAELWLAKVVEAGLDPDDLDGFAAEILASKERRHTLRFEGDQLVEFLAVDGGPDTLGSQATYHLADPDTIEMVSADGVYRTVVDFQLRDDLLLIDAISDTDPLAVIPQTAIFETLPFRRVP